MCKFTKIRKWADEKGFKVEDERGYGGQPCIRVIVNDKNEGFKLEMRESTIYHSVRGMKGERAGLYLELNKRGHRTTGFYQESQTVAIEEMERDLENFFKEEVVEEVKQENNLKEEGIKKMIILTERQEIAKALNFGKYPVLTYDVDKREGSNARVNRGGFYTNCKLRNGMIKENDGRLYLSRGASVMRASISVDDYVEMGEYANAPIIEKGQKVAILIYSRKNDSALVMIMKAGKIDGECSVVTEFEPVEEE
ncbi:hypothetical protein [Priestia megaterium]|uniref:hypothetical protein n=1 Tax=Priestia megaterium TaxID=1404 RepID=UPI000BFD2D8A|nr:hypothetical protein [Priestia megaterium]PGO60663.1 hypothetical protein CN981_08930 [Priestia megaterium]